MKICKRNIDKRQNSPLTDRKSSNLTLLWLLSDVSSPSIASLFIPTKTYQIKPIKLESNPNRKRLIILKKNVTLISKNQPLTQICLLLKIDDSEPYFHRPWVHLKLKNNFQFNSKNLSFRLGTEPTQILKLKMQSLIEENKRGIAKRDYRDYPLLPINPIFLSLDKRNKKRLRTN